MVTTGPAGVAWRLSLCSAASAGPRATGTVKVATSPGRVGVHPKPQIRGWCGAGAGCLGGGGGRDRTLGLPGETAYCY